MNEVRVNITPFNVTAHNISDHPMVAYRGEIIYGVPHETAQNRLKDPDSKHKITNAELLAIHEHGSPVRNIPPRPLLEPVFKKHKNKIDIEMSKVAGRLLEGDAAGADAIMERLAFRMESWCKEYFTSPDNEWAPNANSTIQAWLRKSGKKSKDISSTDKKPLIDTSELRKAIRGMLIHGDE